MNFLRWFVTNVMKLGLHIMCRIDAPDLNKIPVRGPLIVYGNHTGSIEVPVLYGEIYPRPLTGWAKVESWDNWFLNFIFTLWGGIPLHRGEADLAALKKALAALKQGYIFGLSPEGTRNKTGQLIRAKSGIVLLALQADVPLLPVAHWGGENFSANLKKLKRTDFHIRVGEPFKIRTNGVRVTAEMRQEIADEMMYRLAALLPEEYRGEYSDLSKARENYLKSVGTQYIASQQIRT
ncbi:MAG: 1-acyl-sn-glycerol-3-phosphate acyltransferase [Chloroflexi bacterium]|nr:1-acyl-sn-glycerol-3-phosphate acyltransferase [Chloroflexota bacterium]